MTANQSEETLASFPGFAPLQTEAGGVAFQGVIGGSGPPVLLLHGYPQTHLAWRYIAPELARRFTVIAPDLPGYGGSRTRSDRPRWTKRRVANALVELMARLGYSRFDVVGHDRGARAGYRLALDHPGRVAHYVSLAVVPTLDAWREAGMKFGLAQFHWFFLAQPFDLPERLLNADPDAFIETALANMAGGLGYIDAVALDAYKQAFRDPAVRHAICEDYRAGAMEDLNDDQSDRDAGKMLRCPVLILWPESQVATTSVVEVWRRWAGDVSGKVLPGGHLLPEASPDAVVAELVPFLLR